MYTDTSDSDMYRTCHEPILAFMGMKKAILYNTGVMKTHPIIKTPTSSVKKSESTELDRTAVSTPRVHVNQTRIKKGH